MRQLVIPTRLKAQLRVSIFNSLIVTSASLLIVAMVQTSAQELSCVPFSDGSGIRCRKGDEEPRNFVRIRNRSSSPVSYTYSSFYSPCDWLRTLEQRRDVTLVGKAERVVVSRPTILDTCSELNFTHCEVTEGRHKTAVDCADVLDVRPMLAKGLAQIRNVDLT
jgi:hypothetical protein